MGWRFAVRLSSTIFDHKALAAWHVEALSEPCMTLRPEQPGNRNPARERHGGQHQRLDHRQSLGPEQKPAAGRAGLPYAGKQSQQARGNLPAKLIVPRQQSRACQPVNQPAGRHARHPRADSEMLCPQRRAGRLRWAQARARHERRQPARHSASRPAGPFHVFSAAPNRSK